MEFSFFLVSYKFNEKKEEIWRSPMTNAPTPTEMSKGLKRQHKQRHKKFDYTAVADRFRTASWSNYGHSTGVVNRFTGPTFTGPTKCWNKRIIEVLKFY